MRRAALALLLLAPALAGAQAYRWVDAQGRVHYSQTPPPQGDYGQVAPPPPSPGRSPHLEALEPAAPDPGQRAREQRQQEAAARERQRRCEQARRQNAHFQGTGLYYSTGADGQRSYMSAEQIDRKRAEARAGIEEHCD
jgi:hypothetical protein